jgi:hypothetical protein
MDEETLARAINKRKAISTRKRGSPRVAFVARVRFAKGDDSAYPLTEQGFRQYKQVKKYAR